MLYITEPYVNAMTGEMCFTMSKILADKKTVESNADPAESAAQVRESALRLSDMLEKSFFILDDSFKRVGAIRKCTAKGQLFSGTEYSNAYSSEEVGTFRDYTGNYVACLAKKSNTSNFTVVVASNW